MPIPYPDELIHNNPDLPIVDGDNAKGAWITVQTQAELLAIPVNKLKVGQVVRVHNTDTSYYLNDINNSGNINSWVVFSAGGGGGHTQNTDTGTNSPTFGINTDNNTVLLDGSTQDRLRVRNTDGTPVDSVLQVKQVVETGIPTGSSTASGALSLSVTDLRAYRFLLNGSVTSLTLTGTISPLVPIRVSIQADQAGRTIAFGVEYNPSTTYNTDDTILAYFDTDPDSPSTDSALANQAVYRCINDGITGAFNAVNWKKHIILDGGVAPLLQPDIAHITNYEFVYITDPHSSNESYWEATFLSDKIT